MKEFNPIEVNRVEEKANPENLRVEKRPIFKKENASVQEVEEEALNNPNSQVSFLEDSIDSQEMEDLEMEIEISKNTLSEFNNDILKGPDVKDQMINKIRALERLILMKQKKLEDLKNLQTKDRQGRISSN